MVSNPTGVTLSPSFLLPMSNGPAIAHTTGRQLTANQSNASVLDRTLSVTASYSMFRTHNNSFRPAIIVLI
eukprot:1559261-Ditylum_brightwellii.AAC.1